MARASKGGMAALVVVIGAVASIATSKVDDGPDNPPSVADAGVLTDAADAEATYAAYALIGALDRVRVVKADWAADICYGLALVAPAEQGDFGIDVPAGWDIEFAYASLGAASCTDQVPADPIWGIGGTGAVRFDANGFPQLITIDARVVFNDERVPVRIDMEAIDLPVQEF